jgi:hypothetical protein
MMQIKNTDMEFKCPITDYLAAAQHLDSLIAKALMAEMDEDDESIIDIYESYFWRVFYQANKGTPSIPYAADQDVPVEHVSSKRSQLLFALVRAAAIEGP